MRDPPQQRDGFARRGALIEHDAHDQDADEARPRRRLAHLVQADAEPVLVHAVDAAGEAVGEADAGMDALGLDGDQDPVVVADVVVVVASVETRAHHRRAAARRIAQAAVGIFRDRALERNFQAVGKAVQLLPDIGRPGFQGGLGVPEAEGEGPALLAARIGAAARRPQEGFGELLADVIGTSPAFQHIDAPRLGHSLHAPPVCPGMLSPIAVDRQSSGRHNRSAMAGLHRPAGGRYTPQIAI